MRIVAAVVLFAAAGFSAASAQTASAPTASAQPGAAPQVPWALDHGRAADAAAAEAAAAAAAAEAAANAAAEARVKAAAEAAGQAQAPGPSAESMVNGSIVISAVPPRTTEQQKADAEGRAAWRARCRPTVIEDREGLRRTRYAERDCDLSRFNTAGTP